MQMGFAYLSDTCTEADMSCWDSACTNSLATNSTTCSVWNIKSPLRWFLSCISCGTIKDKISMKTGRKIRNKKKTSNGALLCFKTTTDDTSNKPQLVQKQKKKLAKEVEPNPQLWLATRAGNMVLPCRFGITPFFSQKNGVLCVV